MAELVAPEVSTPKYLDIVEVGERVVALREFVEGTVLHQLFETGDGLSLEVGAAVGRTLANIHRIEFEECGELDVELQITERHGANGSIFRHDSNRLHGLREK